jgi:hypothetical protein
MEKLCAGWKSGYQSFASSWCFFFSAKCGSCISARCLIDEVHTVCFLPLVAILALHHNLTFFENNLCVHVYVCVYVCLSLCACLCKNIEIHWFWFMDVSWSHKTTSSHNWRYASKRWTDLFKIKLPVIAEWCVKYHLVFFYSQWLISCKSQF